MSLQKQRKLYLWLYLKSSYRGLGILFLQKPIANAQKLARPVEIAYQGRRIAAMRKEYYQETGEVVQKKWFLKVVISTLP